MSSLNHFNVPQAEQNELIGAFAPMRVDIVEVESAATETPQPAAYQPAPPLR